MLVAASTLLALSGCLEQPKSNIVDDGSGGSPPNGTPNGIPTIQGTPPSSNNVGQLYSFVPDASDPDGDLLTFSIQNKPHWADFDTSTGELSGIPTLGDMGVYAAISISVSDGIDSSSLPQFQVTVNEQGTTPNRSPSISGTPPTSVEVDNSYSFTPSAADPDGDTLTFSIQNQPGWAGFNTTTGRLSGTPSPGDAGVYSGITITVSDGTEFSSLPQFEITVNQAGQPPNRSPSISGTPPTSIEFGNRYSFRPGASDPDGDTLTFSIQNQPAWASFDNATGRLSGTPSSGDVGVYSGITISVSDGTDSASLPQFTITVDEADGENDPPSISGTPPGSVKVGELYSFIPNSSDPDGDILTFSIQNEPSWASFNSTTGRLSGTPSSADVGVYSGITISVSDGAESASLPQFSISVDQVSTGSATVSWTAPTRNTDGTALTDLAGYVIYYGTSSRNYTTQVPVNMGTTTLVVDNLTPGTYYFAATAVNSSDIESQYSAEAIRLVN